MTNLTKPLCLLALGLSCLPAPAREYEGSRANSVPLNGPWEFARGCEEGVYERAQEQQKISWQPVVLPGPFMKGSQEAAN